MTVVNSPAKTRVFVLLAASVLLWACSDSDNSNTSSSESSTGPAAVLNVRETGNLPGMLAIDATDSYPGKDGSFARFVISILDDSGEQRREIVIEDDFDQTIPHVLPEEDDAIVQYLNDNGEPKNIRGTYRIELTVETEGGLSDSAQAVVVLDRDIPVVRFTQLRPPAAVSSFARAADTAVLASFALTADTTVLASSDESDCPAVSCANVSADDSENGLAYVACSLDESCNDVYPATLLTTLQSVYSAASFTLSDTSPLVISAYGAAGADGCDTDAYDGGNGGKGGFAQIFTTVTDVEDSYGDTLYYWTGAKGNCRGYKVEINGDHEASGGDGGASTIVSWTETGSSSSGYLEATDVLLVAGGGGGGSGSSLFQGDGTSGGHGGYSLYTAESGYSSSDGDDAGYSSSAAYSDYDCDGAEGGTGDTGVIGGYGGYGYEGDDNTGWFMDLAAPSFPPVGANGAGGDADYDTTGTSGNPGGGGGGASGGEAGGRGSTGIDYFYCGGGGGGSIVAPSTYFDLSFEPDDRTSNDSDGAVYLYYFGE